MALNLADQFNPVEKPQHKRNKPLARTRGAISTKVRQELLKRSYGFCERCGYGGGGLQAAHTTRRWKLQMTTINHLAHLCLPCHSWADNTAEGREWLATFQTKLLEESS